MKLFALCNSRERESTPVVSYLCGENLVNVETRDLLDMTEAETREEALEIFTRTVPNPAMGYFTVFETTPERVVALEKQLEQQATQIREEASRTRSLLDCAKGIDVDGPDT